MKIGDPIYRGAEVRLPAEVVTMIMAYVASSNSPDTQKSLWASCLVSKTWYAASISHLYYSPHLSPRNFDLFTRTICPPLKARRTRIGIEDMIKHLDMREIAYESSNSLTSRLINRTKASLQGFHSPAVTFSVASLAPLSKCANLALLDMSGDRYSFTLEELLGSIGRLEHLSSLALPKDMLCEHQGQALTGDLQWPENLRLLHAPGSICSRPRSWDTLFRSWPASLTTLCFPDCDNANDGLFGRLHDCQESASFVQRLEIHNPPRHTPRPIRCTLYDILRVFPRLTTVIIPDDMAANTMLAFPSQAAAVAAPRHIYLETLIINVTVRACLAFANNDPLSGLQPSNLDMLFKPPCLRRLEIRGCLLDLSSEEDQTRFEELSELLRDRADPDQRDSSGIFLMPLI